MQAQSRAAQHGKVLHEVSSERLVQQCQSVSSSVSYGPEREEHDRLDAQQLRQGSQALQLLLECVVEQNQAIHGELQENSITSAGNNE